MALNGNAMTTLATAKAYLKIPTLETGMDSMIELFINAASDDIERYCQRQFKSQSYTEYHHGRNQNILLLDQYPIISVTELRIDFEADFTSSDSLIDSDDYRIGDANNTIILVNGQVFSKGFHNIRVIYTAGFSTIPSSLENACLWIVAYYNRMREGQNIGRTSKSKEGESAGYIQNWPPHVKATLDQFRRTEIAGAEVGIWNI
jgi:uncharacterized phiE125 gp8 family phage protein